MEIGIKFILEVPETGSLFRFGFRFARFYYSGPLMFTTRLKHSTSDICPDGIDRSEGKWGNAQEVMDTLWERIRWFLLEVMTTEYEELRGTILPNLLDREFETGDRSWYDPKLTQYEE
jgi:hypothetical protein